MNFNAFYVPSLHLQPFFYAFFFTFSCFILLLSDFFWARFCGTFKNYSALRKLTSDLATPFYYYEYSRGVCLKKNQRGRHKNCVYAVWFGILHERTEAGYWSKFSQSIKIFLNKVILRMGKICYFLQLKIWFLITVLSFLRDNYINKYCCN